MAANAYILINVEPAKTREVIDRLNTVSGAAVREVLGPYDVVMELEAGTPGRPHRHPAPPDSPHQRRHQHRNLPLVHHQHLGGGA